MTSPPVFKEKKFYICCSFSKYWEFFYSKEFDDFILQDQKIGIAKQITHGLKYLFSKQ